MTVRYADAATAEFMRQRGCINAMTKRLTTMQLSEVVMACIKQEGAPMGILVCLPPELRDELERLMRGLAGRNHVCAVMDEVREQRVGATRV